MNNLFQIPILPKNRDIEYIFHLSDIHIRSGNKTQCRYDEYLVGIQNLTKSIKQHDDFILHRSVCIITGDIFHNKSKIETPGISLFYTLISNLAAILPVYIIQGNHDYKQEDSDESDMISAFLNNNTLDNVFYMNKTGLYVANEVVFGLVSISDVLTKGDTSGHVENLPDFPKYFPNNTKYKIALFHGTISNCTLQNYSKSSCGYPIEWFKGYDYGCFGDVHLMQVHQNDDLKIKWGYPGSLIQQNFGETVHNHGYILWNIHDNSHKFYDVLTDYYLINLKYDNIFNTWKICNKAINEEISLDDFISDKHVNNLKIKISSRYSTDDIIKLKDILKDKPHEIIYDISNNDDINPSTNTESYKEHNIDISNYNQLDNIIDYIKHNGDQNILNKCNWIDYFEKPEKLCMHVDCAPKSILSKIDDKNKLILKQIDTVELMLDSLTIKKNTLCLNYMSWNWLLCYGDNNHFNFDLTKNKSTLISGKNGVGKSSFNEIVCIALFGQAIPSRTNISKSGDIICIKKPKDKTANTSLIFTINDSCYKLHREFRYQADGIKLHKLSVKLLKKQHLNDEFRCFKSGPCVEQWITSHIGKLETFLLSSMISQNFDEDFFSKKSQDQFEILDKSLNINVLNNIIQLYKQITLFYNTIIDSFDVVYKSNVEKLDHINLTDYDRLEHKYNENKDKLRELKQLLNDMEPIKWNEHYELSEQAIALKIKQLEQSIPEFSSENHKHEDLESQYKKESNELNVLNTELNDFLSSCSKHNIDIQNIDIHNINDKSVNNSTISYSYSITLSDDVLLILKEKLTQECMDLKIKNIHDVNIMYSNKIKTKNELSNKISLQKKNLDDVTKAYIILVNQQNTSYIDDLTVQECNTWFTQYDDFIQHIEHKYEDVHTFLDIHDSISKNDCPTTTLECLLETQKHLYNEKTSSDEPSLYEYSEEDFNDLINNIDNTIIYLKQNLFQLETNYNNTCKTITSLQKQDDMLKITLQDSFDKFKDSSIPFDVNTLKPITVDDCNAPINDYMEKRLLLSKYKRLQHKTALFLNNLNVLDVNVNACEKELELILSFQSQTNKEIYYNEKCENCICRKEYDTNLHHHKSIELSNLKLKRKQFIGKRNIDKYVQDNSFSQSWLHDFNLLKAKYQTAKLHLDQLSQYNSRFEIYNTRKHEHALLCESLQLENENKDKLFYSIPNITNKLNEQITQKHYLEHHKSNCLKWKYLLQNVETDIELWNTHETHKDIHLLYCKYNEFKTNFDKWTKCKFNINYYNKWKIKCDDHNTKITELTNDLSLLENRFTTINNDISKFTNVNTMYIKLQEVTTSYTQQCAKNYMRLTSLIQDTINKCDITNNLLIESNKIRENKNNIQYWTIMLHNKTLWKQKEHYMSEIEKLESIDKQLYLEFEMYKDKHKTNENNILLLAQYEDEINILKNKRNALNHVHLMISEFRCWLYENKIIKFLINETNNIITNVTHSDSLRLHVDIHASNKQTYLLSWSIFHGPNKICIEKASGFQSFIIGLAMRIALTKIGAAQFYSKQFFIDEGFSSCDREHLDSIQQFIRNLLHLYDSIILVSHLEEIKDSCDLIVSINQNNYKISSLQF